MIQYVQVRWQAHGLYHFLKIPYGERPDNHAIAAIVGPRYKGSEKQWDRVFTGVVFLHKQDAMLFKLSWRHDSAN